MSCPWKGETEFRDQKATLSHISFRSIFFLFLQTLITKRLQNSHKNCYFLYMQRENQIGALIMRICSKDFYFLYLSISLHSVRDTQGYKKRLSDLQKLELRMAVNQQQDVENQTLDLIKISNSS